MSFLMDALRKAEESKPNNNAPIGASGLIPLALEPLAVAPLPSVAPHALPLPVLAQHFDSLNADLAATSAANVSGPALTPPSNKRSPAQMAYASSHEEQARNTAWNLFAAKSAQQARTRRWRFLGLLGAALLGIGGYFWGQMQQVTKGSFARPLHSAPVAAITFPVTPTASTESPPTHLSALIADLVRSASAAEVQAKPEGAVRAMPQQAPSDPPIRLSTRPPKANPTLERAYQALQADQLSDARRDYEQVLRGDARNVDALLGLATLAVRQGQTGDATDLYLRALEADPKEINARAGLINLQGQADPGLSESRLKTLLASQPDSAVLNFVRGNLQAGQNRWSDAQQAYFRAYTSEPNNADYLYNLAVSLDHLQQNKLAAQYYQSALKAAGARHSAFDKDQVRQRLLDLQP